MNGLHSRVGFARVIFTALPQKARLCGVVAAIALLNPVCAQGASDRPSDQNFAAEKEWLAKPSGATEVSRPEGKEVDSDSRQLAAWATLSVLIHGANGVLNAEGPGFGAVRGESLFRFIVYKEAQARLLREMGLSYARMYPGDAGVWDWLMATMALPPEYNASFDASLVALGFTRATEARNVWESIESDLVAACLKAKDASDQQKYVVEFWHIYRRLIRDVGIARSNRERLKIEPWQDVTVNFVRHYAGVSSGQSHQDAAVMIASYMLDLTLQFAPETAGHFLKSLRESGNGRVRDAVRFRAGGLERSVKLEGTFPSLTGGVIDLAAYRGKVVLLEFWATTCNPCVKEMPAIKRLHDKYGERGLVVIGVSCDFPGQEKMLKRFLSARGIGWPQIYDGLRMRGGIARQFGVVAIPQYFVFSRTGDLVSFAARGEELDTIILRESDRTGEELVRDSNP